jgi:epoxide hydrolase
MEDVMKAIVGISTVLLLLVVASAQTQSPAQPSAVGKGEAVVPFKIHVSDAVLRDLKDRLARTRFPDEIEGQGFDYGVSLAYMKELVAYWRDKFDWRKQEAKLNAFDQFMTNIDGLDVHFVHQRSPNPNALPIISLQGFPSSFAEYAKVIGPLTDPVRYGGRAEDAFHFVTFSLPGIGFTEKPTKPGQGTRAKDAEIAAKLMARLGYTRYAVQGGDAGAGISRDVALENASHVVGLHLNYCTSAAPPGADPHAGVTDEEWKRMEEREAYFAQNNTPTLGMQGWKPQIIGYGFSDSPIAQAAWLTEEWRVLSDSKGKPETKFTKDEILTNVMIYWVTETGASSVRRYAVGRRTSGSVALPAGRLGVQATPRRVEGKRSTKTVLSQL